MASVQRVIAANLRRWRESKGWAQDRMASHIRADTGLAWSRATLAAIETGHRGLSLDEVLLLAHALNVPLATLAASDEDVEVGPLTLSATVYGSLLRGKSIAGRIADQSTTATWRPTPSDRVTVISSDELENARRAQEAARGDTERTVARQMGVSPETVGRTAVELWGHGLADERDRQLTARGISTDDPGAPGHRAHITRALVKDLVTRLPETSGQGGGS